MSFKQFSTSSPALPGSSFPAGKSRQPVTALVPIPILVLFLMAVTLLSLLMEQTEVTLTAIGAILSLSTRATGEPNNVLNL